MTDSIADSELRERLTALLADRPLRVYRAVLSAEPDAMAWARDGAPAGALVTADYQLAPRGRGGLEWEVRPGHDVAFSMVLRPALPESHEGWLYPVVTTALSDAVGGAAIRWPDIVHVGDRVLARVGVQTGAHDARLTWAVVSVLLHDVAAPTAIAAAVHAIERRLDESTAQVLEEHRARSSTIGRQVRARLMPMGPSEAVHDGEAVAVRDDGGLAIRTASGALVRVVPQVLGVLDEVPPGA